MKKDYSHRKCDEITIGTYRGDNNMMCNIPMYNIEIWYKGKRVDLVSHNWESYRQASNAVARVLKKYHYGMYSQETGELIHQH